MVSPSSSEEWGVVKTIWHKATDGKWQIHALKGLMLKPRDGHDPDFFQFESVMEMVTDRPYLDGPSSFFNNIGTTDFHLKQSIVPVVSWRDGDSFIKCIGTAFIVSCTGLVVTACHVLLDPHDTKQAELHRSDNIIRIPEGFRFGVIIPINPVSGRTGSMFFPFLDCRYWGEWRDGVLPNEEPTLKMFTDTAVCKIALLPDGRGHQPLTLGLRDFRQGERAYALGYAQMPNIPIVEKNGTPTVPDFRQDLYVSAGAVEHVYPDNHRQNNVPTPGPCFDFRAKVPGKMSGGPILGPEGACVRGVVSRSYQVAKQAYGAMIGPTMNLPLHGNVTLRTLMETGNEGIPKLMNG